MWWARECAVLGVWVQWILRSNSSRRVYGDVGSGGSRSFRFKLYGVRGSKGFRGCEVLRGVGCLGDVGCLGVVGCLGACGLGGWGFRGVVV